VEESDQQYNFSKELLRGVVALIFNQQSLLPVKVVHHQNKNFKCFTSVKNQFLSDHSRSNVSHCPPIYIGHGVLSGKGGIFMALHPSSGTVWLLPSQG